jgi:hypothetical protein
MIRFAVVVTISGLEKAKKKYMALLWVRRTMMGGDDSGPWLAFVCWSVVSLPVEIPKLLCKAAVPLAVNVGFIFRGSSPGGL